jgi:predicted nuclease of predicted toxin-antitoxin system
MRFLLDANMPRSAIDTFVRFGHEVELVRDVGLAAAPDKQVAAHALKTGAVLVSRDLDFA